MSDRPSSSTSDRGRWAEDAAVDYLVASGLEVVARNVIAGGVELDVVATSRTERGDTYVFVEVRSRRHAGRGHPLETVGPRKRARLVRGATAWLVARGLWERVHVRFDVVSVVGSLEDEPARGGVGDAPLFRAPTGAAVRDPDITWIQAAFEA